MQKLKKALNDKNYETVAISEIRKESFYGYFRKAII